MVDAPVLRRRIDALVGYLARLERFASMDRAAFASDADAHDLAERWLHLAVESALDIANHLIADQGYEAPDTYRDSFAILVRHGDLAADLGQRLQGWAGLRNILVRAYLDIDHGLTWDAIAHLGDLRVFAQVAAGWLGDAEPA
jgi:uncharacterized protein YutE (UPF0331/DUF86 family)